MNLIQLILSLLIFIHQELVLYDRYSLVLRNLKIFDPFIIINIESFLKRTGLNVKFGICMVFILKNINFESNLPTGKKKESNGSSNEVVNAKMWESHIVSIPWLQALLPHSNLFPLGFDSAKLRWPKFGCKLNCDMVSPILLI